MDAKQRTIITNEDDNRKLEVYTDGDVDASPSGIGMFAKDPTTTLRILRADNNGNLYVNLATKLDSTNDSVAVTNTGTLAVHISSTSGTMGVRVGQVDGTVAVYFSQSNPKVNLGTDILNIGATASIGNAGNSVSGSTSGVSTSGVQIVAPEASRVIKVYAFSIMSTAAVNLTSKFTNGSGASPVELWRVAMISPTGGVAGANLAVTPPGYLFATPSGATLCIVNDSASLIHYSVAYFKESS